MKHYAAPDFWTAYNALPANIRALADRAFSRFKDDSNHPSLHLKKVGRYWSVRVGTHHRALGVDVSEGILWFWIGNHDQYERLIDF